jgi:hypothetical protein
MGYSESKSKIPRPPQLASRAVRERPKPLSLFARAPRMGLLAKFLIAEHHSSHFCLIQEKVDEFWNFFILPEGPRVAIA